MTYIRPLLIALLVPVLLNGCAGAFVAGAATGAAAATDRRTIGVMVEDQSIELKAINALLGDKQISEKTRISVTSFNQTVLLTGQSPNQSLLDRTIRLIRPIENINKIHNRVTIEPPVSLKTQSKDSWITTRVKSNLMTTEGTNALHIKVITENANVYLMGLATRQEAAMASEVAAEISEVRKVVPLFDHLD